jgi:hypothetical protein
MSMDMRFRLKFVNIGIEISIFCESQLLRLEVNFDQKLLTIYSIIIHLRASCKSLKLVRFKSLSNGICLTNNTQDLGFVGR